MISWVQRNFQHHFKVIFGIVLIGTIVSFVATIGATSSIGYNNRGSIARDYFGHNLGSAADVGQMVRDAGMSAQFQTGAANLTQEQVQNYAYQRTAALHLADELHIPQPTEAQLAEFIKTLRIFQDKDGRFDANRYNLIRTSFDGQGGSTEVSPARIIADDVRVNEVGGLLSGPGYVFADDVRRTLALEYTTWSLETATVDFSSFKPEIDPTEAELQKFFSENSFRYDIPPRVSASYVEFPASAYMAAVSATNDEVQAYFDANENQFNPQPAAGAKPADPKLHVTLQAVRPIVEVEVKIKKAQRMALDAAANFALGLYDNKITPGPSLDAYLAASRLTAKPLAPFSQDAGPAELGGSKEIAEAAFRLDADRYFSEELPTPNGAVILLWRDTLPSRKSMLMEVSAKVAADYVENERRVRFAELGQTLRAKIQADLKSGLSFDQAVSRAAGGTVSITTKHLAPFQMRNRPKDLDESVAGELDRLGKGDVSEMAQASIGGVFVFAADKTAPDLSPANPHYAETRSEIAFYSSRITSNSVMKEIVETELKRSQSAEK
jgi:peptidyl-prolyl cis-trans isomerase D